MSNKMYFFTDLDLLENSIQELGQESGQTQTQAFGPVTGNETTQYRVTNIFAAINNVTPRAYAVCKGLVVLQPVEGNPEIVNLILKPEESISHITGLNFVPIRFIIYKGILKESLLETESTIQTASQYESDLLKRIKQDYSLSISSSEALGYDTNNVDNKTLDELFYSNTKLTTVNAGDHLAYFNDEFGIEIIVDSSLYDPTLEDARKFDHMIEVENISVNATDYEKFLHKHKKEEILHYIDACALYGSLYSTTVSVKKSTEEENSYKEQEIYENILCKFVNRNKIYLDVRNSDNRSFNYAEKYNNEIQIIPQNSEPQQIDYYENWQILILDATKLLSITENGCEKLICKICLPAPNSNEDNNQKHFVYLVQGDYNNTTKESLFQDKGKDRFKDIWYSDEYSYPIDLGLPYYTENNSIEKLPISSYIRLKYCEVLEVTDSNTNHFSDLQFNTQLKLPFVNSKGVRVYNEDTFLQKDGSFMANIGIAQDVSNTTLFAYPENYNQRNNRESVFVCSGTDVGTNFLEKVSKDNVGHSTRFTEINDTNVNTDVLDFYHSTKATDLESNFLAIVITNEQFSNIQILTESVLSQELDSYIIPIFESLESDDKNTSYMRYKLQLMGYNKTTGIVVNTPISTGIYVFGKASGSILRSQEALIPKPENALTCTPSNEDIKMLNEFIQVLDTKNHYLYNTVCNKLSITQQGAKYTLSALTNDIPLGYLSEFCTTFYMWLYAKYMREYVAYKESNEDPNTKPTQFAIDFSEKLLDTIFSSTYPQNQISKDRYKKALVDLLFPDMPIIENATTDTSVITSLKNRLSDLIKTYWTYFTEKKFEFNDDPNPNKEQILQNFIKKSLEIYRDTLWTRNNGIDEKSRCLYEHISPGTLPPQSYALAAGNGDYTIALLEEDGKGITLFNYQYKQVNNSITVGATHRYSSFKNLKHFNNDITIHLSAWGFNMRADTVVNVSVNRVNGVEGSICELKGNRDDSTLRLTNKKNSRGQRIVYKAETKDVTFSGMGAIDRVEVTLDVSKANNDEVMLMVNLVEPTESYNQLELCGNDLFESDKFDVKTDKKEDLLQGFTNNQNCTSDDLIDVLVDIPLDNINMEIYSGFIGKINRSQNTNLSLSSRIVSDKDYSLFIPYAKRTKEAASSLSEYKFLRYGYVKIDFGENTSTDPEIDNSYIDIYVESFVDPVRSRLDQKIQNNLNLTTSEKTELQANLDSFTTFAFYSFNEQENDHYVIVENDTKIPSYNAILCALRVFGILECVQDFLVEQDSRVATKLSDFLNLVVISADPVRGRQNSITYNDYLKLKDIYK